MKKPLNCTPRNHRGVTLVELIAGLSIIALIIAGALTLYRSADETQKANQILVNTTALQQAMKAYYQGNYTDAGGAKTALEAINRWPASASNITPAKGTDKTSFTLTVSPINKATCVAVLTAATGWTNIKGLNGTEYSELPLKGPLAATACTPDATTTSIIFTGS